SASVRFTNLNTAVEQIRLFSLAVLAPPSVTLQPSDQSVLDGATAAFNASVTGGQPLSYQWQFDGINLADGSHISGSASASLIISNVSAVDLGSYRVIVTNAAGGTISSNALLAITPSQPVVMTPPSDEVVAAFTKAQLSVTAVGTKPFSYQWYSNG